MFAGNLVDFVVDWATASDDIFGGIRVDGRFLPEFGFVAMIYWRGSLTKKG
jgi:hypothetical protein